ncbi:pantoate--beta-alanine ligase [Gracilibacillus caseinilyticus]|uniref:Pantothenate synthetase n=1 Tax=Gracilibacillus caseinilyticus TaxID=2932256 RepID=A0ABY4ETK2_9BACI|nr:pantoate--beta-alanine ligase [Gracilibacillus caseinilyticus]UOQ47599.1 pantoate--beta-alanine ligase [Gracilibacillus caseinilyticus]
MNVIRTVKELTSVTKELKQKQHSIGFVPTMGFLHEGHTTLMNESKKYADILIASIFVNPLQFGPDEDFERYPRNEERDLQIAEAHGVDYLFMPTVEEMYPDRATVTVTVQNRADVLCGRSRTGHFDGVATVLTKLFHLTKADFAFFGLKDAQQVAVVKGLVDDFNFDTTIIAVPTVREKDGLAKSSRNVYLSEQERNEAVHLNQSLQIGKQLIIDGERNTDMIREKVKKYIYANTSGQIDYVEVLAFPSLTEAAPINQQIIIAVAVQFSKARLIDNVIVDQQGSLPKASV